MIFLLPAKPLQLCLSEVSLSEVRKDTSSLGKLADPVACFITCPFRKSYPRVAMMQSTQDGHSNDGTRPLDCSMQRRILVQ
jgi:hypothetical protein